MAGRIPDKPSTMTRKAYWAKWKKYRHANEAFVRARAKELKSDGCTGVPDFYLMSCWEHDIAYRTGLDIWMKPITRAEADRRKRWHVQMRSHFGTFSPMSWWRWAGVRLLAKGAWQGT